MLEASHLEPLIERSSRASPLSGADVRELLDSVAKVIVCRGRKTLEIPAQQAGAKDLQGPTGNIRAPLLAVDDTLLVGFNQEALAELLGG